MAGKAILHMLTPGRHISPFDATMAVDAGYEVVVPYEGVGLSEVADLVQDAIFARPPDSAGSIGVFFGGDDAGLALDMMEAAKAALAPPFGASLFADPQGSFTTAAAMLACVEKVLAAKRDRGLRGLRVAVLGATGVVGYSAAVIAAGEGAAVTLVGHDGPGRVSARAAEMKARFGVEVAAVGGATDAEKAEAIAEADVVLAAARAGVRVLSAELLAGAPQLLLAADVNAVPPLGIEGVGLFDFGAPVGETAVLGLGALAIGQVKSRTEAGLFRRMLAAEAPLALDFRDAFALARSLVSAL